jgi:arabinofuranan 3-O-arabinosyltransferase
VVLAIPVAFLVRLGLAGGFRRYELPAFGCLLALLFCFTFWGLPTGLWATLIVGALVLRRAGPWWRREQVAPVAVPASA